MTMRFVFHGGDFSSSTARLLAISPGAIPIPVTIETRAMSSDEEIAFTHDPFEPYGVTIRDNTGPLFRSGLQNLAATDFDEEEDFERAYFVLPMTHLMTEEQLGGFLPEMPLENEEEEVTIETLALSVLDGRMRARGTGEKSGLRFNYTYRFTFKPNTNVTASRLINIETLSIEVTGANGGILGFLADLIVNVISFFMQNDFAKAIERQIQKQVDASIRDQLDAQNVPAGTTVSCYRADVRTDEVELTLRAAIPATGACPAGIAPGSVRLRASDQMNRLRLIRDKVLKGTPRGDAYIRTYYKYSPQLVLLAMKHRDLLKQGDAVLKRILGELDPANSEAHISKTTADGVKDLLRAIAERSGTRGTLKVAVIALLDDVDLFAQMPVRDALHMKE